MAKIIIKDNRLNIVKKNVVLKLMKEKGISRVNPEALKIFNDRLLENAENLICKLRQHIQIKAKKTLEKQDVIEVIQKRNVTENYDL